jgi:acyl-CoA thioesterase II
MTDDGSPASWSDSLTGIMDLRADGEAVFLAPMTTAWGPRLFGGLVAAQSMAAACRTVRPDHHPQSMHAYFILGGDPEQPLRLEVERTRDGKSFTTRRVVATQAGAAIFEMSCSFHRDEDGADWSTPMPEVHGPESLARFDPPGRSPTSSFFEMRSVDPAPAPFALLPYWVRTPEPVPDDEHLRTCVLTYLSDLGVLAEARPRTGEPPTSAASLDHAIWFHRPYDPHEWHLYSAASRNNHGGRGLGIASLHRRDGSLVATVVQEGLFRSGRPI